MNLSAAFHAVATRKDPAIAAHGVASSLGAATRQPRPIPSWWTPSPRTRRAKGSDYTVGVGFERWTYAYGGPVGQWFPLRISGIDKPLEGLIPEHGLPRIRWPGFENRPSGRYPIWNVMRQTRRGAWRMDTPVPRAAGEMPQQAGPLPVDG